MAGPRITYRYDVFLSHSSADKPVVRELAEGLRAAGLRVWFDEWIIKPGDPISVKIEEGLEHSEVLLFCMSANAFGSEWAGLERHTALFRDPLNRDRRFVPLRLDDAPIKAMLRGYAYLDWRPGGSGGLAPEGVGAVAGGLRGGGRRRGEPRTAPMQPPALRRLQRPSRFPLPPVPAPPLWIAPHPPSITSERPSFPALLISSTPARC
ncbi:MAG: toll/interleukin-1 receptor domain-containing protein [Cyanobium sp.]